LSKSPVKKEAIDKMVYDQGDKLYNLAAHIVENGLNTNDRVQVTTSNHDKTKYNVLEGNRRIVTLKLLNNPDLIDSGKYSSLKNKFRKLHEKSKAHPITEIECTLYDDPAEADKWIKQKKIQKEKNKHSLLKVGFSTFFLNRTNRSGILNAGIIGGRQQTGKWKIDARYNKSVLINRIERIALYKNKFELHNSDAIELVRDLLKTLPAKTLFYFDPPYYLKGKGLYLNYYGDKDHQQIATEISKVNKQKWILTYDNVQPIKQLYNNYRQVKYTLNYSAAKANKGEEVMIFSNNIYIVKHPVLTCSRIV